MDDTKKHYHEIQKVLLVVLVLNWAVAAAKISHTIQKEIMNVFPQIVDVLVHMEPDTGLYK